MPNKVKIELILGYVKSRDFLFFICVEGANFLTERDIHTSFRDIMFYQIKKGKYKLPLYPYKTLDSFFLRLG